MPISVDSCAEPISVLMFSAVVSPIKTLNFLRKMCIRDSNYTVKTEGSYGLSNIAATLVNLMGYKAPDFWDESMIELKK